MDDFIEELYFETIKPNEDCPGEVNDKIKRCMELIATYEEELPGLLDETARRMVAKVFDAYDDILAAVSEAKFKYGFTLGAQCILSLWRRGGLQ